MAPENYEEYTAEQLQEYLQYAGNYLKTQGMEFVSDELHLDPENPEDIKRFIAIAFAEHGDPKSKSNPKQVATNTPGDEGDSRGPWQIRIPTWRETLGQYDIFDGYESLEEALDRPELNAIAAVIVAQQGAVEPRGEMYDGINNWETVMDTKLDENGNKQIVTDDPYGIKKGNTPIYEGTENFETQIEPPQGQMEEETKQIKEFVQENTLEEEVKSIPVMKRELLAAKRGSLFSDPDTYVAMINNRLQEIDGSGINKQTREALGNTNIDSLSDGAILDLYTKHVHPYVSFSSVYINLEMEGSGDNIIDISHNTGFDTNAKYYDTKIGSIISGKELRDKEKQLEDSIYRYYKGRLGEDSLNNLQQVYTYLLRQRHPFIRMEGNVELAQPTSTSNNEPQGQNIQNSEMGIYNKYQLPEKKPSETFLNNWEMVTKVGSNNQTVASQKPQQDTAKDFINIQGEE